MTRSFKPALAGIVCLAALAGPVNAQDSVFGGAPDSAPAIARAEPGRAHLVDGVLYWRDRRLADTCAAFGGRFVKLAGSPVFSCTPLAGQARLAARSG